MKTRMCGVLVVIGMASIATADSIWDRRDPRAAFLFTDNRARGIGDILTVAINESTEANEREQRALDKGHSVTTGMKFAGSAGSGSGSMDFEIGGSGKRGFNGSAQLTSDRRFLDRMTVTVVDVMPNGNLVIEGSRSRIVAGERRELRITGVVRPADIGQQNTVESRFIANFRISYFGKGTESQYVNPGWFKRKMQQLWPF